MLMRGHPCAIQPHQYETVSRRKDGGLTVRGARELVMAGIDDTGLGHRRKDVRLQFDPEARAGGLNKIGPDVRR